MPTAHFHRGKRSSLSTQTEQQRQPPAAGDTNPDPWRDVTVLGALKPPGPTLRRRLFPLFRQDAIETRQQSWLGETLIAPPLSTNALTLAALAIATLVIAFLAIGEYTRKERVAGEIQTSFGIAKIASPVNGVVMRRVVNDGQCVKSGDALFLVSAERSTAKGNTQAAILAQIGEQKNALASEYRKQKDVAAEEAAELTRKIIQTNRQLEEIRQAIQLQERRVELADEIVRQYRNLVRQKFFSITAQYDKERELLDAQRLLSDLRRQDAGLQRDVASLQSELKNHPLRTENKLSAMERQVFALEQSGADAEGKRELIIPAPQAGCITAILVQPGYTVAPDKPMAVLLPEGAKLEAHLYAPSRAIGFIREGNPVLLRYEAYPYQKFGQYGGKVLEVARAAIPSTELPLQITADEPMYRIRVDLDAPEVVAYGKGEPLQAGMRLEADVLIDTRKLYEWVFEPIYSLSGKV